MHTNIDIQHLIDKALQARMHAYSPYSKFKVGASLLDNNNIIHQGVNVENASYGLTSCAERNAISTAIAQGMSHIVAICVIADTQDPVSPCGACRQVINEFVLPETEIIVSTLSRQYKIFKIQDLLPYSFQSQHFTQ